MRQVLEILFMSIGLVSVMIGLILPIATIWTGEIVYVKIALTAWFTFFICKIIVPLVEEEETEV
jgi:hypothetical protein